MRFLRTACQQQYRDKLIELKTQYFYFINERSFVSIEYLTDIAFCWSWLTYVRDVFES